MKSLSQKYKDITIYATLIQDDLTSVWAQKNTDSTFAKNIYNEVIYKTNNLSGAIDNYIKNYLEKGDIKI